MNILDTDFRIMCSAPPRRQSLQKQNNVAEVKPVQGLHKKTVTVWRRDITPWAGETRRLKDNIRWLVHSEEDSYQHTNIIKNNTKFLLTYHTQLLTIGY